MKKTSRSHHHTLNELNVTPLLDLAFVLLVIFIITTPQLVTHLEMNLPSATPPPANPDAPKPEVSKIAVDDRGQIFLDGRSITLAALGETLKQLKANDPGLGVVVKGADEVEYQHMISVLDLIQQLDIKKVGLATEGGVGP